MKKKGRIPEWSILLFKLDFFTLDYILHRREINKQVLLGDVLNLRLIKRQSGAIVVPDGSMFPFACVESTEDALFTRLVVIYWN